MDSYRHRYDQDARSGRAQRRSGRGTVRASVHAVFIAASVPFWAGHANAQTITNGMQDARSSAAPTAQPSEAGSVPGDIIVTAQKRSQSIQHVPLAVTALGSEQISNAGAQNITALQGVVPNVQVSAALGVTSVFLRGVGTNSVEVGSNPSIAYHVDGVYISRPRAQIVGFFDVERLEVVKGPQGDLYGRNATGGSINVITKAPTRDFSGEAKATYGTYNSRTLEAAVSGPLAGDVVTARIAGVYRAHDGYGKNIVTGNGVDAQKEYGGRARVRVQPGGGFDLDLSADYYRANDSLAGWHYAGQANPFVPLLAVVRGGVVPTNIRDIASPFDPHRSVETYGFAATASLELAPDVSLKSITGYRNFKSSLLTDLSGGSVLGVALNTRENSRQFSEEVQAAIERGPLNAVFGAYYFNEKIDGGSFIAVNRLAFLGPPFSPTSIIANQGMASTDAYAAFAHVEYKVLPDLTLIGGLRYSYEKRSMNGSAAFPFFMPNSGSKGWSAVTPKFTVQYEPSHYLTLYASASRGFKSGAFQIGISSVPLNPEYIWSYEAGIKGRTTDGTLQGSVAVFRYDYSDLVVTRVVNNANFSENASSATINGFEADVLLRPSRAFSVSASFGYLDATYGGYTTADPVFPGRGLQNLSGNHLTNAPKFSTTVAATYEPLVGARRATFSADIALQSKIFFTPFDARNSYQPSNVIANARAAYPVTENLEVGIYGRNLTNATVKTASLITAGFFGFGELAALNEPRTYGVEAKVKW